MLKIGERGGLSPLIATESKLIYVLGRRSGARLLGTRGRGDSK